MLAPSLLRHAFTPVRHARWYSCSLPVFAAAAAQTTPPVHGEHTVVQHPYFVPRNTRGSLPVYTDIRNSNKYLTLIRNVEGNVDVSASLLTSLPFRPVLMDVPLHRLSYRI